MPSPLKIPAFAFSTRNKSEAAYRDRLATLKKKFGVEFSFRVSAKLTPQRKSAITRKVRAVRQFLKPDNRFVFVAAPEKKIRAAVKSKSVTKAQATAKGIFVQVPETRKRGKDGKRVGRQRAEVTIDARGEVTIGAGDYQTSKKTFRARDVVADPKMILAEAKKRGAVSIFVSINGYRGKNQYSVGAFYRYFSDRLAPAISDQIEEEQGAFQNFFSVEFVKRKASRKKKK